MSKTKVIIDTDPGTDDILALLFALAARPEDLEVALISVTYGNVDVRNCLRNVVSMFNVIEKEMAWRREQGLPEGFEGLKRRKPVVAVGASEPLGGQVLMADYYHGVDGLGNVHTTHPHHTSHPDLWSHLFDAPSTDTLLSSTAINAAHTDRATHTTLFTPSTTPSHLEILQILASHPPDTITLIAIGPLTNLALAASHDPKTFLKAKEVITMNGAISEPGNITPVGEFNCIADPIAAARLYALTSPNPASTMPPSTSPYPDLPERRLNTTLFPLDITTPHTLSRASITSKTAPLISAGSPLAEWVSAFLIATFDKSERLYHESEGFYQDADTSICFHDPVCIWYALSSPTSSSLYEEGWVVKRGEDVRVETVGQWTRGMCVVDRRGMRMLEGGGDEVGGERGGEGLEGGQGGAGGVDGEGGQGVKGKGVEIVEVEGEVSGDSGGWLSRNKGNRVGRCVGTPGPRALAPVLLGTIFGE